MKIISVDFNGVLYRGGIASFNRKLYIFFNNRVKFLTFFYNSKTIDNETNLKLPKKIFKIFNYIFRYNISSVIFFVYLLFKKEKNKTILILNSPSFIKFIPKGYKKIILVQHQDSETMWKNSSGFNKSEAFLKKCINKVSVWIVLSSFDKKEFVKSFNIDVDKIQSISHGVDIPVLSGKKIRNKNIVMLTRLDNNQKRIDLAILAMKSLPEWNLNIFGEGADRNMLEELVKNNDIKNVFFNGVTNDVCSALDGNSLHLMTSDFEGFGISNIEALSRGLPIICRNTFPSVHSIISHKNNGVILSREWNVDEFINSVEDIYNNYDFYSNNALLSSEKFQLNSIKDEWNVLIEDIYKR